MATPARRLILENLKTTLEGITVANGYKTNVLTVEPLAKSFADTPTSLKPWIGVHPQREALTYEQGGNIRSVLTVLLICHISGNSPDERSEDLNDLLDDIIAILDVDTTRGTNAVMTTITTVETDEGDPDAKGQGSMVVSCDVTYFRTGSSS